MNATRPNTALTHSLDVGLTSDDLFVEQIGKTVARSLDRELAYLSPKIVQNLEKSRQLALSMPIKRHSSQWNGLFSKWQFIPSVGPISPILLVLLIVFGIAQWQQGARIDDIAAVDAAILTDTVPPDAYADDGFKLFLKKMLLLAKEAEVEEQKRLVNQNQSPTESSPISQEQRAPDISTNQ